MLSCIVCFDINSLCGGSTSIARSELQEPFCLGLHQAPCSLQWTGVQIQTLSLTLCLVFICLKGKVTTFFSYNLLNLLHQLGKLRVLAKNIVIDDMVLFLHLSTTHWRSRPSLRMCLSMDLSFKTSAQVNTTMVCFHISSQKVLSSPLYEPCLFLWTCPQVWPAGTHGVQVGTK